MSNLRLNAAIRFGAAVVACASLAATALTAPPKQSKPPQPNQSAPTAKPAPATKPAPSRKSAPAAKPAPAKKPKLSAEELAKKKEILDSERFHEARAAFEEWLAVQKVYKKEDIPKLKARFRQKINAMTSAQLAAFLEEMEGKLSVLMSPDAQAARNWIGYFVSAKAVLPAEEVDKFDIVHMSAADMENVLKKVEVKRGSLSQASQAFNASRQAQVQAAREQRRRDEAARAASRANRSSAPAYNPNNRSNYAPRKQYQGPQNRMSYYISPWGGVGIMINP